MQQIVERFNIKIFELNWITFRGVEELIKEYIHNNYKTYSDGYDAIDLNPINAAFKMWEKCVLGFEYYLNNRNRLNSEAWHNNSFFESIEDFQVIDDFYFELKNSFFIIDERNIVNFKWIFNRVISIILINHFLSIKYENIPLYLLKYKNQDLIELHWWNRNNFKSLVY